MGGHAPAAAGRLSKEPLVEIDKRKIVEALRRRGLSARADWVDRELPDRVDTVRNAGLLATLGIDPADLTDESPR
jgi:hypothetical protein